MAEQELEEDEEEEEAEPQGRPGMYCDKMIAYGL